MLNAELFNLNQMEFVVLWVVALCRVHN